MICKSVCGLFGLYQCNYMLVCSYTVSHNSTSQQEFWFKGVKVAVIPTAKKMFSVKKEYCCNPYTLCMYYVKEWKLLQSLLQLEIFSLKE